MAAGVIDKLWKIADTVAPMQARQVAKPTARGPTENLSRKWNFFGRGLKFAKKREARTRQGSVEPPKPRKQLVQLARRIVAFALFDLSIDKDTHHHFGAAGRRP